MSKNPDRIRLGVGIPAYGGQISAHHARMWTEFGNTIGGSAERFDLAFFDYFDVNGVDQCRNLIFQRGIETGADWVLMIDADTWVAPSSADYQSGADAGFLLLRMISEAARAGANVAVAPVMSRVGADGFELSRPMVYLLEGDVVQQIRPAGRTIIEIDRAATAVFAFDVEFAVTNEILFKFEGKLSEDHYFCKRVKDAGGKIVADPRVRTGHLSRQSPIFSKE